VVLKLNRFCWQVRGGLTFREGHYICEAIYDTGLLVALDLMVRPSIFFISRSLTDQLLQEVNPSLADAASAEQTVAVGCSLVRAALGQFSLNSYIGRVLMFDINL
jgi:arginase